MAGEINKELSRQLSLKLQDPVSKGEQDTVRIPALSRLYYLKRGMYRFVRILSMSYPKLTKTVFSKYVTYERTHADNHGMTAMGNIIELYSAYVKRREDEEFTKAKIIDAADFLDVMTSQNALYVPDLDRRRFFACRIDGVIEFLPGMEYDVLLYFLKSIPEPSYTENDIELAEQYWDILLDYAAAEHYLDVGQADMATGFRTDAAEQLQVLLLNKADKERHDDKN